jgi:hypothetical protein
MKSAGRLVLIACTLVLTATRVSAQEASASAAGAQWDILALGGGSLVGSEDYAGAGGIWEFGAGNQVVSSSRIGGRLLAAVVEDSVQVLTGSESETSVALDHRTPVERMGTDWVGTGLGLFAIVAFPVSLYLFLDSVCC